MRHGMAFGPSVKDEEKGLIPYQTLSCSSASAGEPVFASGMGLESLALHELGHSFVNPRLELYGDRIDGFPALSPELQERMIAEGNGPVVRNFVAENVLRVVTPRGHASLPLRHRSGCDRLEVV